MEFLICFSTLLYFLTILHHQCPVNVNVISSIPIVLAARLYLRGNGVSIEENECLASWNV
jgi:hypothetical protein